MDSQVVVENSLEAAGPLEEENVGMEADWRRKLEGRMEVVEVEAQAELGSYHRSCS